MTSLLTGVATPCYCHLLIFLDARYRVRWIDDEKLFTTRRGLLMITLVVLAVLSDIYCCLLLAILIVDSYGVARSVACSTSSVTSIREARLRSISGLPY